MSKKKFVIAFGLFLAFMSPVIAEPTTSPARIISLRVKRDVGTAGLVYIQLSASQFGPDTYTIDLGHSGSRELFSTALEGFHAGKNVKIETNCNPCNWGTELLSLYIME